MLGGLSGRVGHWAARPACGLAVVGRLGRVGGLLGWQGASSACSLGATQGVFPLEVRWWHRWPGGQKFFGVWGAGLPGCSGRCFCLCVDACGVPRGCVCVGLGLG